MENVSTELITKFQEKGVIISDNKKESNTNVTVTIDSKMVHLKDLSKKCRFDRMIPIKQVASCEVRRESNTGLIWAMRIIGAVIVVLGITQSVYWMSIVGALMVVLSFFIHDSFYVEISASNGVPIKCKFEGKSKNDDINDRFVSIVRQLICDIQ